MNTSAPASAPSLHNLGNARLRKAVAYGVLTSLLATSSPPSYAALTQLATAPLASTTSAQVKPNIMFLLDTSGSMAWDYLPDSVGSDDAHIGYKNSRCNLIYYNPSVTYTVPKKPDGTNFGNASFTGAFSNGFQNYPAAATTNVNISTSFKANSGDTAQPAYYYNYVGAQTLVPHLGACLNDDPNSTSTYGTNIAATGGGNWVKVRVSSTSGTGGTDERVNFANWYTYYRTRILAMKSAASRAFNGLTDSYRVGLITITPGNPVASTDYLAIGDFTTTQKANWYTKFFTQGTGNSTPLREALARVGRHYAGKTDGINSGMTPDPVQYSCQQNFTILTTDGYWNTGDETVGPVKMDGTTLVGQQDGDLSIAPLPLWDGGVTGTLVNTDKGNLYTYAACTATVTQLQVTTTQLYYFSQQRMESHTQNYYVARPLQETHTQNYYLTQRLNETHTQNYYAPLPVTETHTQAYYAPLPVTETHTQVYYFIQSCSGAVGGCSGTITPALPAWNPAAPSASWTAGACPTAASKQKVTCNTANATASASAGTACPAPTGVITAGGTTYTCTWGAAPAFTAPAYAGWTAAAAAPANTTTIHYTTATGAATASASAGTACPAAPGVMTAGGITYTCTWGAAPAFTAPAYAGWTAAAAPANTTTIHYTTATGAATAPAPVTSCPVNAGGASYTCANIPAAVPAFNAATPTANGWTQGATPAASAGYTYTAATGTATAAVTVASCPGTSGVMNASGVTYTCAYPAAPAFVAATPTANGYVAGVTPANTTANQYTSATGTATAAAPVAGSCPTNAGGTTYTCTNSPASAAAFPSAPTDPTSAGYVAASTASCPAAPAGQTYTCNTRTTVTLLAGGSACPAAANGGSTVSCATLTTNPAGQKIRYATTTYTTTTSTSGGVVIGTPATTTSTAAAADLTGICYPDGAGTLPSLPNPNPQRPVPSGTPFGGAVPAGCATTWPCSTTTAGASGGSPNSLADVAQYYYNTDLRPTMEDNVPSSGQAVEDDKASWQHMTTFTMGLGLSGNLTYRSDYRTATTGSFAGLRAGTVSWPAPVADSATAIDDLWHAAVNGRGQYFSAADPDSVVSGLQTALAGVNARVASAAAAATSNLEPVAGDNFAYTAKYTTQKWTGELEAHQIDLSTGAVLSTVIWSAQSLLDPRVNNACDDRTIYLYRAGVTNNRVNFTWNSYACDSSGVPTGAASTGINATEQANFNSTQAALLSQWATMTDGTASTVNQRGAAPGENLVNYLRGQKGKEGYVSNDLNALYRSREHVLGDIVSAQPVYVKAPFASYQESTNAGYGAYKSLKSARTQMVYVAANDGMLHAFDAAAGSEAWAYIPNIVLPNLYKLADNNYANAHVYSVDGTPAVGDVYDNVSTTKEWKTILVAGLNGGGKGYYAVDVTDPATPKGLWEFKWSGTCNATTTTSTPMAAGATSDCHLGYTYNNPLITKLANNRWVVIVTSGYNNVSGNAGDGQGYLYVLDAISGEIIYKISTLTGSAGTPSGLNHIVNWVDNTVVDNKTLRVYGVDLLGNIWRFDVNDNMLPAGLEATLIGTAKSPSGVAQPISTRPELAEVGGSPMVFVATGKLLGAADITDTQVHSIWGIKDPLIATTAYADLRAAVKPMAMTQVGTGATATRTIVCSGTNAQCNSTNGWVADLPDSGERVNVDMKLQLGTLVVASNVPQNTACNIGGYSWLNYLNFSTGTAVSSSPGNAVSQKLSDSLAVGLNIVRLPDGKTVVITTTSDAKQTTVGAPFDVPAPTGRRISWREITQ